MSLYFSIFWTQVTIYLRPKLLFYLYSTNTYHYYITIICLDLSDLSIEGCWTDPQAIRCLVTVAWKMISNRYQETQDMLTLR